MHFVWGLWTLFPFNLILDHQRQIKHSNLQLMYISLFLFVSIANSCFVFTREHRSLVPGAFLLIFPPAVYTICPLDNKMLVFLLICWPVKDSTHCIWDCNSSKKGCSTPPLSCNPEKSIAGLAIQYTRLQKQCSYIYRGMIWRQAEPM